jgi:hypothetical protein
MAISSETGSMSEVKLRDNHASGKFRQMAGSAEPAD